MPARIRPAVRGLVRHPLLSLAAIFCLALGLGATTAIFTAVNAALLRPLPFPAADRLVSVFRTTPNFATGPFSAPNYLDLARETRTLETLAAATSGSGILQAEGRSMRASIVRASDDYLAMLRVRPALGRIFRPGQDGAAETPVLVLTEELWREQFGGDPSVLGRAVRLDGEIHEIIGVLPRDFRVPHGGAQIAGEVWVPLRISGWQATARRTNYLLLQGRLADGAAAGTADRELHGIMERIIEAYPELRGEQLRVVPLHRESKRGIEGPLTLLLGAVALVLLIAVANVASLLLARGAGRQAEWAIRTAIGASRRRILSGAIVESAILTTVGAAAGLALAWAGTRVIESRVAAVGLPQLAAMPIDLRVLGFGVALAVAVALLSGLAPAWQAQRSDPQDALRTEGRSGAGRQHNRFLRGLIVAEVALSLILLLGAGLLLRGFRGLVDQDPGFDASTLLTLSVHVPADRYPDGTAVDRFLEPALEAVEAVPGVSRAAAITLIPYTSWGWNFNIRYEGVPGEDPTRLPLVETRIVTPGFFDAMGMTLLAGRPLEPGDDERPEAPVVAVANRTLAERHFPGEDAVGRRFHLGDTTFATIVGVVSDIKNFGPDQPPRPEVYRTYDQGGRGATSFPLIVRVTGDPSAFAQAVGRAVFAVDPEAALSRVRPMEEVIAASMGRPRFYLALMGIFAGVAVALALAGLYGVMSYVVEQRRRELGIRAALGGSPGSNLALVIRGGAALIGAGILAGLGGGLLVTRLLEGMLYGVSPLDAAAWAAAPLLLAASGIGAVFFAARRAARVRPMVAMRE
ncbi:MAG TPA: ADOP family duplicated permease [Gemmatimonadota bacterium]|nr:ADOP family duplicated permease [Gemmatimonadota bacterium]